MIDYDTPVGQVRLLANDIDDLDPLISDVQIAAFLTLNGGNVRRAAADALDTIATSEALVSKAIRTQDLQTDGAKVADALRRHAATLRALAADEDDDSFAFEIVPPATGCRPELTEYPYPQAWGL